VRKLACAAALAMLASAACVTGRSPGGRGERGDRSEQMRSLARHLSGYAKARRPGFIVVGRGGLGLLTSDGSPAGKPAKAYIAALDGVLQDGVFHTYARADRITPEAESSRLAALLDLAQAKGLRSMVIDYPGTAAMGEKSAPLYREKGYLFFLAQQGLDAVSRKAAPAPPADVAGLGAARDLLVLLNPVRFDGRRAYLRALQAAPQDVLVVDLFHEEKPLTAEEVSSLRAGPRGRRLVLVAMSLAKAGEYRYYWKPEFKASPPSWLGPEDPHWAGDYQARFWDPGWKTLLCGGEGAYLDKILAAGFDGVVLDGLDAAAAAPGASSR